MEPLAGDIVTIVRVWTPGDVIPAGWRLEENTNDRIRDSYGRGFIDGSNRAARRIGYAIQQMASPHYPEEIE